MFRNTGLPKEPKGEDIDQFLVALIDRSPTSIIVNDMEGKILYANQKAVTLHGYSKDEFLNLNLQDLIVPESLLDFRLQLEEIQKHGTMSFEVQHFRKDGTKIALLIDANAWYWGGKDVFLNTAMDITAQKQAEALLRESEALFRTLAESSPNMIFIYQNGRIVYVNRRCVERMGYTFNEFYAPSFSFLKLIAPVHQERIQQIFQHHSAGDEVFPIEYVVTTKDGRRIDAIYGSRLISYQGKPAILGVITEITERKLVERELQRYSDILRAIIEAAPVAIIGLDLQGNVHNVWNPAAEKMLGWRIDEVMGRPLPSVPTEKTDEFKDFREQIHGKLTLNGVEVRQQRRDGIPIDYSIYASPLHDAGSQIIGNIAVLVDITERKAAEKALLASEERYRLLFENASDLVIVIDANNNVVSVSPSVKTILEYDPAEIVKKSFLESPAFSPRTLERLKQVILDLLSGTPGKLDVFEVRSKSGRKVVLETLPAPILKEGQVTGIMCIARDITARQAAEDQLRQISEFKSSLISQASHELKTPLTSILGWADLLCAAKREGKNLDEIFSLGDLESLLRNAERLEDIINDFLDVGRMESGKLSFSLQTVEFAEILQNSVDAVDHLALQKKISIQVEESPSIRVKLDRRRMEQVIINLLSNAIKYSPAKTRITIKTNTIELNARKQFQILVTDEGYGFTPEELKDAMTPFGKGYTRQEQKRSIPGTGLGLFISSRIIEQHGGTLEIRSKGPNLGTQVEILLPLD